MTQSCQINLFSSDCSLPPEELGQGECAVHILLVIGNAQKGSEATEPDSTCAKSALSPIDTPNTSPDTSAVALNDR